MASLSDAIERYLEELLRRQRNDALEIRRNELAQQFDCAPSQINYVLETRFTTERGYIIESRRGGGGYVRIIRVSCDSKEALLDLIHQQVGTHVSQDEANHYVKRLLEEGFITRREAAMMRAALHREVLGIQLPVRDRIRARLLKAMILAILKTESLDEESGRARSRSRNLEE